MSMLGKSQSTEAGFSNQQALLLLLVAFPIGLIGLALVMTVAMRPLTPQAAQGPTPVEEPKKTKELATSVETPLTVKVPNSAPKPLVKQTSSFNSTRSTCWFQMETGGRLIGSRCSVSQRLNANGDRVFDVIEASGLERTVVLWDNLEAEVFAHSHRYTGNWSVGEDGDVRVILPGGTFAFKPPA
jgi:hypothetical protein